MAQIDRQILREYREKKQDYIELEPIVFNLIKNAIDRKKLNVLAIHHRVKEKSIGVPILPCQILPMY